MSLIGSWEQTDRGRSERRSGLLGRCAEAGETGADLRPARTLGGVFQETPVRLDGAIPLPCELLVPGQVEGQLLVKELAGSRGIEGRLERIGRLGVVLLGFPRVAQPRAREGANGAAAPRDGDA